METLDLLQELIAGFAGTVVLVSHDRDFLDRTVTTTIVPEGDGRWTEYAGGYSDMLAQRGTKRFEAGVKRKENAAARPDKAPVASPRRETVKKLSYKQKFALETLPQKIEALTGQIELLESRLADPAFYERDAAGFAKTASDLDAMRDERTRLEEEWLEL